MAKRTERDHPEVTALKRRAKDIRKQLPELTHMQAIEIAAQSKGFRTYAAFLAKIIKPNAAQAEAMRGL